MSPLDVARPKLIVGCGYLGRRVAARWLTNGHRVAALTRRNAAALTDLGVEPVVGDVLDPGTLRDLPPASTVLYAVGLDRTAGKSMREVYVDGLRHVLDTLPACDRFVYVSSTSVYGQSNGEWVNEESPTDPSDESGRVVLDAERLLRSRRPDAIVLRFAGIYGPDRLLRKQQLLNGEPLVGDAEKWLNLVQVDDGADAILSAEARGRPGETYNIADDEPASRRSFYTLLAELLHAQPAKFEQRSESGGANRRVDATKAKVALGWRPRFATYREGLASAVASGR
jgi:nucleoside-diphosphate-sugar epimerase